jgi:prepilin peptidase CpaA
MINELHLLSTSALNQPLIAGLLLMLLLAVVTDLNAHKIPNLLVLAGLIVSLLLQVVTSEGAGWINWLSGIAVAFACFIPLYLLRGMAAGDVKLMMAVGGFLGYPLIITAVTYSYLAGGVIAISYVFIKGRFGLLMRNLYMMMLDRFIKTTSGVSMGGEQVLKQSAGSMTYAVAIAVGTLVTLYLELAH